MIRLQGLNIQILFQKDFNAIDRGLGAGDRRDTRHTVHDSCGTNLYFVFARDPTRRGINDKTDFAVLDVIQDIGPLLENFMDSLGLDTAFF